MSKNKSKLDMESQLIASTHIAPRIKGIPADGTSHQMADAKTTIKIGKGVPARQKDFKIIEAQVNVDVAEYRKEKGLRTPRGVSPMRYDLTDKMMELVHLDYKRDIICKCPKCRDQELVAMCPVHGEVVPVTEGVDKDKLGAVVKATMKAFDKIAPNLANMTQEVNVVHSIQNYASGFASILLKHVPSDRQESAMEDMKSLIAGNDASDITNDCEVTDGRL